MTKNNLSRRNFIQKSALGMGIGAFMPYHVQASNSEKVLNSDPANRLPREVWIATLGQEGMSATDYKNMVDQVFHSFEEISQYKPDIICFPEVFPYYMNSVRSELKNRVNEHYADIIGRFSDYAKANNCYIICPTYTTENGRSYNAAVLIDRKGKKVGEYRKIHTTTGEMSRGVSPGPLDPPVFKTDFGIIGIQICFDMCWDDGWKNLRKKGAEIVFWPSAYGGGATVNTRAWQNKYCVVSSTMKDTTKICDITGEVLASTGRWNRRWAVAPVNLEKVFLHSWPYSQRFNEIKAKYGRKVLISSYHEEEWSIIESRSPDVKISDIMKEYELKTHEEHIAMADQVQNQSR